MSFTKKTLTENPVVTVLREHLFLLQNNSDTDAYTSVTVDQQFYKRHNIFFYHRDFEKEKRNNRYRLS